MTAVKSTDMPSHGLVHSLSNEAHVYSSWRYLFRGRRIKADYRALARDCGARRSWRQWPVLPMPHRRLAHDAVGNDAVRRRRHALLAALDEQIRDAVHGKVANLQCRNGVDSP
jgi:uncharacterized protein VirK/YbjX